MPLLNMNLSNYLQTLFSKKLKKSVFLYPFFLGLLLPLSFAPFHIPGIAILSLAFFYKYLNQDFTKQNLTKAEIKAETGNNLFKKNRSSSSGFFTGLAFGLGYFGLGTSWVYVSIHEYGHLNCVISALLTLAFTCYLALFPATTVFVFKKLKIARFTIGSCLLFASLWVFFEYCRSYFLSGFPWLLLGYGQMDMQSKYLFPLIGVYGVSFWTCFLSALLASCFETRQKRTYLLRLSTFVVMLISPMLLKNTTWSQEKPEPLSTAIIQANLSMRDKWDEQLFEQILAYYIQNIDQSLGKQMIVMPESAIPLPSSYVEEEIASIHQKARNSGSAVLLGIPKSSPHPEGYFNALISLGLAEGSYLKQHLVPFGEYIPKAVRKITQLLSLPDVNLIPGDQKQRLVQVQNHSVATLICYELAYDQLLRKQLPQAEWIVSISDSGWFGHSLALYQQQQMAQVRSLEVGRYQILANNDGLSSVINSQGEIVASLPAFAPGTLNTKLFASIGITPWVRWGNKPVLFLSNFTLFIYSVYWIINQAIAGRRKRSYPYQPQ